MPGGEPATRKRWHLLALRERGGDVAVVDRSLALAATDSVSEVAVTPPVDSTAAAAVTAAASDSAAATRLAAIIATGAPRNRKLEMSGFYRRRVQGRGVFFTDSSYDRHGRIENVLRRVSGLRVVRYYPPKVSANGATPPAETRVTTARGGMRSLTLGSFRDNPEEIGMNMCYVPVFMDGAMVISDSPMPGGDLADVSLDNVTAIEIYRTSSETPPEFAAFEHGCGVILLWTQASS